MQVINLLPLGEIRERFKNKIIVYEEDRFSINGFGRMYVALFLWREERGNKEGRGKT